MSAREHALQIFERELIGEIRTPCKLAIDLVDALSRAGLQITPQAGEAEPLMWVRLKKANGNIRGYDTAPPDAFTLECAVENGEEIIPVYRTAPPRPACDGNHGAPICADPECWQRPSPVAPVWQPKCDLYRVGPYDTKRGGYPVLRGTDGASWGLFITRDDATDWARYRNCLIDIHSTDALPSPPVTARQPRRYGGDHEPLTDVCHRDVRNGYVRCVSHGP